MKGMPIGPPSQRPAPKSACKVTLAPIVPTSVAELAATGSWLMGAFQTLFVGKTGQFPIVGCAHTELVAKIISAGEIIRTITATTLFNVDLSKDRGQVGVRLRSRCELPLREH